MKWSKIKGWYKNFLALFGVVFIVYVIVYTCKRSYNINHYPKYTIGTTVGKYYTSRALKVVKYNYAVRNISYNKEGACNECLIPGGRYFVKFSSEKPELSEILQNNPVPDSIKTAPVNGWDSIPGLIIDKPGKTPPMNSPW